jgi:hypothetical protein
MIFTKRKEEKVIIVGMKQSIITLKIQLITQSYKSFSK